MYTNPMHKKEKQNKEKQTNKQGTKYDSVEMNEEDVDNSIASILGTDNDTDINMTLEKERNSGGESEWGGHENNEHDGGGGGYENSDRSSSDSEPDSLQKTDKRQRNTTDNNRDGAVRDDEEQRQQRWGSVDDGDKNDDDDSDEEDFVKGAFDKRRRRRTTGRTKTKKVSKNMNGLELLSQTSSQHKPEGYLARKKKQLGISARAMSLTLPTVDLQSQYDELQNSNMFNEITLARIKEDMSNVKPPEMDTSKAASMSTSSSGSLDSLQSTSYKLRKSRILKSSEAAPALLTTDAPHSTYRFSPEEMEEDFQFLDLDEIGLGTDAADAMPNAVKIEIGLQNVITAGTTLNSPRNLEHAAGFNQNSTKSSPSSLAPRGRKHGTGAMIDHNRCGLHAIIIWATKHCRTCYEKQLLSDLRWVVYNCAFVELIHPMFEEVFKKYENVCADLKDRAAKGPEGDADRLMADNCLECLDKWQSSWYRNYVRLTRAEAAAASEHHGGSNFTAQAIEQYHAKHHGMNAHKLISTVGEIGRLAEDIVAVSRRDLCFDEKYSDVVNTAKFYRRSWDFASPYDYSQSLPYEKHWKKVERMVDGDSSRNPYLGVSWLEENGDIVIASSSAIEYALREGCSRGTDTRTLSTNVKTFLQRGEYF